MKEFECLQKIQEIAKIMLKDTGILKITSVKLQPQSKRIPINTSSLSPDLIIRVKTPNNKKYSLIFEIKSLGQPRYVRMAINQLQAMLSLNKNQYGVIGAPYLSEESRKICSDNNIGFIEDIQLM